MVFVVRRGEALPAKKHARPLPVAYPQVRFFPHTHRTPAPGALALRSQPQRLKPDDALEWIGLPLRPVPAPGPRASSLTRLARPRLRRTSHRHQPLALLRKTVHHMVQIAFRPTPDHVDRGYSVFEDGADHV